MVICLERGADLPITQLMPLPITVSCSSKIQIGFTFLVLAHPGNNNNNNSLTIFNAPLRNMSMTLQGRMSTIQLTSVTLSRQQFSQEESNGYRVFDATLKVSIN